jgi:hypothetical protein
MTASRDFDWNDDDSNVVVPEQAAIAVYLNPRGNVVIRQAGQYRPDEDSFVIVAPDHAAAVADAILRVAGLHRDQPDDSDPPKPKDRTTAERLRRYTERNRTALAVT